MSSAYNASETKRRLGLAVQMRDKEFTDEKTGRVTRYARSWIKKICNIRKWQAVHLGIFPNADQIKQMRAAQDAYLKRTSDARREERGKKAFSYGTTFKQNQRNRPSGRGA